MKNFLDKFWDWYERHYLFNLSIATLLFFVQLFHLYWLFTDVILGRLTGESRFLFSSIWGVVSSFLDYSEIPAIITTTVLYIHILRKQFTYKTVWLLLALNIQWVHILWITDEVVIEHFNSTLSLFHWAAWLAWIAILIDYLELPVIYDTVKRLIAEIRNKTQGQ